MTRDEEIEKAANEHSPPLHPAWAGNENSAFQDGAIWADANIKGTKCYAFQLSPDDALGGILRLSKVKPKDYLEGTLRKVIVVDQNDE